MRDFFSTAKSENSSCTCACTQISRNDREMYVVPNVQQLMMSILLIQSQSFGNFHVARVLLLAADRRRWARMCVIRNTTSCSDIESLFQAQIIKLNIMFCHSITSNNHRIFNKSAFDSKLKSILLSRELNFLHNHPHPEILRHYTTTKRRNWGEWIRIKISRMINSIVFSLYLSWAFWLCSSLTLSLFPSVSLSILSRNSSRRVFSSWLRIVFHRSLNGTAIAHRNV